MNQFRPNITPEDIFIKGSFGGTYWRPIYSSINNKNYLNEHLKHDALKQIQENKMTNKDYNININKYKVKVGQSLKIWEDKNWIKNFDPYGWVHWYCNYSEGRRIEENNYDKYQMQRWLNLAGPEGRFRKSLMKKILEANAEFDDYSISPKIRQTLLHWGYELTEDDYNEYLNNKFSNDKIN